MNFFLTKSDGKLCSQFLCDFSHSNANGGRVRSSIREPRHAAPITHHQKSQFIAANVSYKVLLCVASFRPDFWSACFQVIIRLNWDAYGFADCGILYQCSCCFFGCTSDQSCFFGPGLGCDDQVQPHEFLWVSAVSICFPLAMILVLVDLVASGLPGLTWWEMDGNGASLTTVLRQGL